ncbi:hypothetical protein [Qipengyuania sp.]
MHSRLAHPFAIAVAVLSTFGAAHFADRLAYGLQMGARGLAPIHRPVVLP